jgi:hypothetical protein
MTAHHGGPITPQPRTLPRHTYSPPTENAPAATGCLRETTTLQLTDTPPERTLCLVTGTDLTIQLATSAYGRWDTPTISAPNIATIINAPGPGALTITINARTPGQATIRVGIIPPPNAPGGTWQLHLTITPRPQ